MALINRPTTTEKNRAAHQANGRKSRGAVTAAGKERSRAAHLRHGFYSQARDGALRALGEDPAELAALISSAFENWQPANDFQARLTEQHAHLLWRLERAQRIQESLAASQVQQMQRRRSDEARRQREWFTPRVEALQVIAGWAADPRFYAPNGSLQEISQIFDDRLDGALAEILELMHRLRQPGTTGAGARGGASSSGSSTPARPTSKPHGRPDARPAATAPCPVPPVACPDSAAAAAEVKDDPYLASLAEWDNNTAPIPWPTIPVAEGAEREELRVRLMDLAKKEAAVHQSLLEKELRKWEGPLARIALDEVQAAPHPHAGLMRREEESCFRQFIRVGNALIRIQKHVANKSENERSSGYVDENKQAEVPGPGPEVHSPETEACASGAEVRGPEAEACASGAEVRGPVAEAAGPVADAVDSRAEGGIPQAPKVEQAAAAADSKFNIQEARTGIRDSEFPIPNQPHRHNPLIR